MICITSRRGEGQDIAAPDPTAEQDLLRRAALGDRTAFAALVDAVGPALYRYALRMVHDPTDAEDCVQEALAGAWFALETYRGDARVRTWLFGIQANVVRRHLRRRRPIPVEDRELQVADGDGPVQHAFAIDLREALDAALADLPPAQRAAWLLVTVEGLSYAEAAMACGISQTALHGRLDRAKTTLRERLAAWR